MESVDASDPAGDAPAPPAMSMPQLAVAGGVSGLVARFATHPFDTLKTQMQVAGAVGGGDVPSSSRGGPASTSASASASARHRGALETARALVRREGPLGFYRGFGAVVAGIPFASAAYFGGYEAAKRAVEAFRDAVEKTPLRSAAAPLTESPTFSYVASGVIAQSFASVAYTPIDVVKERMQASGVLGARLARGRYDGVVAAYRTILKTEGARGVFRGYWASNFTWWPFSVVYFVAYEHMRDAAVVYVSERSDARNGEEETNTRVGKSEKRKAKSDAARRRDASTLVRDEIDRDGRFRAKKTKKTKRDGRFRDTYPRRDDQRPGEYPQDPHARIPASPPERVQPRIADAASERVVVVVVVVSASSPPLDPASLAPDVFRGRAVERQERQAGPTRASPRLDAPVAQTSQILHGLEANLARQIGSLAGSFGDVLRRARHVHVPARARAPEVRRAGDANAVALDRRLRGVRGVERLARERHEVFAPYRVHADATKVDVVVVVFVFVFGFSIGFLFDADDSRDARSGLFLTAHWTGSLLVFIAVVLFAAVRWTAAGLLRWSRGRVVVLGRTRGRRVVASLPGV